MVYDVLMPQLGMAQDTAILVSWAKTVGDAVKTGDVLMEVETDKSTVEVEAAHDGFIVDIKALAGAEVPVGDVIAVISENADDVVEYIGNSPTLVADSPAVAPEAEVSSPSLVAESIIANSGDRILASPKARMEAKRSGVDLAMLVQSGIREPIHFDDVVNAPNMIAEPVSGNALVSPQPVRGHILLKISRKPVDDFLHWIENERPGEINPAVFWMSVATRAMRNCGYSSPEVDIRSAYHAMSGEDGKVSSKNADQFMLSSIKTVPAEALGHIEITDLRSSTIVKFEMNTSFVPISIVLKSTRKNLKIRCSFDRELVDVDQALHFSSSISKTLANPILSLV